MYFIKHGELRNQSPSVETIPALDVTKITYGCCMSIIVMNKTGICMLAGLNTIRSSDVVWVPSFRSVRKLRSY